ncbi:LytR C-terminal domain-containing protein [Streptomyces sp. NPDC000594]|uniref:LytR C-terminal domain-containing protein n=1 Tax=Streptomyces sp. NPDC000594 TaxID=3154261 RepID=UPI00332C8336
MSMLTPPGMGGKYRVTGDRYPRMRRPRHRRRIVTAMIVGAVTLGAAGWGTAQLVDVYTRDDSRSDRASGRAGDCKPAPGASAKAGKAGQPEKAGIAASAAKLQPRQITVNVYNATPRGGLAKAAADELKKRGFTIGKVGNATAAYDKKVTNTAVLLGSRTAAQGSLKVLGTQLKGATAKADGRKTADVDLIIGTAYKALAPKAAADAALTALRKPAPAAKGKC